MRACAGSAHARAAASTAAIHDTEPPLLPPWRRHVGHAAWSCRSRQSVRSALELSPPSPRADADEHSELQQHRGTLRHGAEARS